MCICIGTVINVHMYWVSDKCAYAFGSVIRVHMHWVSDKFLFDDIRVSPSTNYEGDYVCNLVLCISSMVLTKIHSSLHNHCIKLFN